MRSKVAEELRREQTEDIRAMSIEERIALALELGERDLQLYIALNEVDRETAVRAIRREHRNGRRYSRCMEDSNE
ncbi:MAG TPA: hypothetical protein VL284_08835 [Thermoanaerobaculia bacterium]|nr:hypothetical protein [Thermoanaerobaculia bacterium]